MFNDKIAEADSYLGLLVSTMSTALIMLGFFSIQWVHEGKFVLPLPKHVKAYIQAVRSKPETEEEKEMVKKAPRPLMSLPQWVHTFIFGMSRIFEALIVLTLAWAVGAIMSDVGANRLFAIWIIDSGLSAAALPTLAYIISMFMALATGSSWGKFFYIRCDDYLNFFYEFIGTMTIVSLFYFFFENLILF